jgi:hypothetical protein
VDSGKHFKTLVQEKKRILTMTRAIKYFIQLLALFHGIVFLATGQIQSIIPPAVSFPKIEAVDIILNFHITNTMISIELNNIVTFKALQATFFHVPSADVDHMTSVFSDSRAQLNTDTLVVLLIDYSGDTLVPGHYILAEIPITVSDPSTVSLGKVVAVGSNNQEINNIDTTISTTPVAVLSEKRKTLPSYFSLGQNYPNPFNPSTEINISLSRTSRVRITIYTILGQEIRTLFNGQMQAGEKTLQWDGRDQYRQGLASGIYTYRMVVDNFIETKKMMLLK